MPAGQEARKPVRCKRAVRLKLVAEYTRPGLSELPVAPSGSGARALEIAPDGLPMFRRDPASPGITPPLEQLLALEQSTLAEEDRPRAGPPD